VRSLPSPGPTKMTSSTSLMPYAPRSLARAIGIIRPGWASVYPLGGTVLIQRSAWKGSSPKLPTTILDILIKCMRLWFAEEPATCNPRAVDPSLTLTWTQYSAMVGNRENSKPFSYA
jgi:hypothetical protein